MIQEKSCGAIIFFEKNRKPIYLLLKYKHYWGFVKGKVEENESEEETAIREAKEEANLKIEFVKGFKERIRYYFKIEGRLIKKEVIFMLAAVDINESRKTKISWEHEGFKWHDFETALRMLKHKNEKNVLKKANDFLKNHLKQKTL